MPPTPKPVEQAPAARPGRRTRHGISCPQCGSVNVTVSTTRTQHYTDGPAREHLAKRRRNCRCTKCGRTWWQTSWIREEFV